MLGLGKPETFDFLGFKHICGKTKRGRFLVLRQTVRKRMQAKLLHVKIELRRRMHDPVPEVGAWLKSVVGGHFRYFGVPGNGHAMAHFRFTVSNLWHRALCRRSQHGRVKWERMKRLIRSWLPPARICHPYPSRRLRVTTGGKSRMREIRLSGSVRGVRRNPYPYRDTIQPMPEAAWVFSGRC